MSRENNLLIIHTGGTLGMRPREPDQALAPDEVGRTILEFVPELATLAQIETRVLYNLDSTDIRPEHWLHMAREISSGITSYDGVVITHGTDAMAYTASALSFLLRNLPIPVILTGSQRPLADVRSDGRANLIGAVDLALREIREVAVYFDGKLYRGNRATKYSTFAFGAFRSPNFPLLAELGASYQRFGTSLVDDGPFRCEGRFDSRVMAVHGLPGQHSDYFEALLEVDIRGLLLVLPGVGNLPDRDGALSTALEKLTRKGTVVAVGSQSPHGRVRLERYEAGRRARDAGAVGIGDMTIEAAAVKLMYLLGTHGDPEIVRRKMAVPLAGEISTSK